MQALTPRSSLAERLANGGARFRALNLPAKIAFVFLTAIILVALFAPWLAPHDPLASGVPARPPSAAHWFGTDRLGRDILSRIIYGSRVSLLIGLGAVGLAILVGGALGAIAATASKWGNEAIMRLMDIIMAFPGIALAAVLLVNFGNTMDIIIIAIAVVYIPQLARVVRANVLAQWEEDYVRAERVLGASRLHILVRHIVRNIAAPVLVFATVMVADAIIFEASLTFLGAGVQPPDPSWGNILSYGRNLVLNGGWWATTFAGLTILLTVLALNILAEGMTDAMVNPRLRAGGSRSAQAEAEMEVKQSARLEADVAEARAAQPALIGYLDDLQSATRARSELKASDDSAPVVLEVANLHIRFPARYGDTALVENVNFTVRAGETMGLVGESGCGKSITAFSILGLLGKSAQISGQIRFHARDGQVHELLGGNVPWQSLRGTEIAMIYQDALSALNPSLTIRSQLQQLIRRGGKVSAETLLEWVKLDPAKILPRYPHELSGGQRQRVLIAMALSREPRLVIADEPTTALDVTVQAEVVALLEELQREHGFALVFVSHDLALVAEIANRITVMYAGQVVEAAPVRALLENPRHEYTRGLLASVLSTEKRAKRLYQIPGSVPAPQDFARGDRFAPRSLQNADPAHKPEWHTDGQHGWASQAEKTS
ncbi:MAG: dipeptide/oligopeptide/nickel ABC transporter permease/ATP-binding protein [Cardiobacteriaceae bacterium]|nr:dipeptide/oligopeptide/nickel ABC transporter permease/ATP-binding protein [Cardiobacteriaceae bacterium]